MSEYKHHLLNDKWVIEDIYRGMRNGFFVEAGAVNGINSSATYVLEHDYKWGGICVEPIDRHYEKLRLRRKCRTDNRALYSSSGRTLEFVELGRRSGLSGLDSHLRQRTRNLIKVEGDAQLLVKETVTLFDLLNQHRAPEIIHYLCLDVEGAEPEILRPFPFDAPYKLLAVSIEGALCDEIMQRAGYRSVRNPHTDKAFEHFYLHKDIEHHLPRGAPLIA